MRQLTIAVLLVAFVLSAATAIALHQSPPPATPSAPHAFGPGDPEPCVPMPGDPCPGAPAPPPGPKR